MEKKSLKNTVLVLGVTIAASLVAFSVMKKSALFGSAANTTRSFSLKPGKNQAAPITNGLASQSTPNTDIVSASAGAFVNTTVSCFGGGFTYGDEASGTWATLTGVKNWAVFYMEIHNPLTVSGHYTLSGAIKYTPKVLLAAGDCITKTDIAEEEVGDKTSTSYQAFDIDIKALNLTTTPNVVGFIIECVNDAGATIIANLDNMVITYGC